MSVTFTLHLNGIEDVVSLDEHDRQTSGLLMYLTFAQFDKTISLIMSKITGNWLKFGAENSGLNELSSPFKFLA